MRCSIQLSWRNGDEDLNLERCKNPEDHYISPLDGSWRAIQQVIDVMDQTYTDARAALTAMLPEAQREDIGTMVCLSPSEMQEHFPGEE